MRRAADDEVEVATIVFDSTKPMSAPGVAAGSAITSKLKDRKYKHTIQYMPRMQHFRITHIESDTTFYVPVARVSHWFRLES